VYKVRADVPRNRLYVTLQGNFDTEEARAAARRVMGEMTKLKLGFVVIVDISELEPGGSEEMRVIEEVHQAYKSCGLGRLIRVVGSERITKSQFQRIAAQSGVKVEFVESMAEAEDLLKSTPASKP